MPYQRSGQVVGLLTLINSPLIYKNSIQIWQWRCTWQIPPRIRRMLLGVFSILISLLVVVGLSSVLILLAHIIVTLACRVTSPFTQSSTTKSNNVELVILGAGLVSVPLYAWHALRILYSIPIQECVSFPNILPPWAAIRSILENRLTSDSFLDHNWLEVRQVYLRFSRLLQIHNLTQFHLTCFTQLHSEILGKLLKFLSTVSNSHLTPTLYHWLWPVP